MPPFMWVGGEKRVSIVKLLIVRDERLEFWSFWTEFLYRTFWTERLDFWNEFLRLTSRLNSWIEPLDQTSELNSGERELLEQSGNSAKASDEFRARVEDPVWNLEVLDSRV